jgi:hypothetical protein
MTTNGEFSQTCARCLRYVLTLFSCPRVLCFRVSSVTLPLPTSTCSPPRTSHLPFHVVALHHCARYDPQLAFRTWPSPVSYRADDTTIFDRSPAPDHHAAVHDAAIPEPTMLVHCDPPWPSQHDTPRLSREPCRQTQSRVMHMFLPPVLRHILSRPSRAPSQLACRSCRPKPSPVMPLSPGPSGSSCRASSVSSSFARFLLHIRAC